MSILERPGSAAPRRTSARWAWVAVGAVPLWFVAVVGLALAFGAGGSDSWRVVTGTIYGLFALAVPVAALVLAVRARRAGAPSGRAAVVVSASLLGLTVAALVLIVSAEAALVTVGLCLLAGVVLARRRSRRS